MSFKELIQERYSVRNFADREIEEEKLQKILDAGRLAPTACNLQPQRTFIVRKPELLEKLRKIAPSVYNAPVVLILGGDTEEAWKNPFSGKDSTETDVAIAAVHMMLQAQELGIGSTWVQWADFTKIKEALSIPENITVYGLLNLGYAAENAKPAPQHEIRKNIEETVTEV